MVQVIQRPPSFGEIMGRGIGAGLGQGLGRGIEAYQQKKSLALEDEALKKLGIETSGVSDPDLRKAIVATHMKKKQENLEQFYGGIDTVQKMKDIVARGKIGRGSSMVGIFDKETAGDRSEFEQLGRSLIPLVAAGVPIRNQREFDEYRKVITNPSANPAEISGALDALEGLFAKKLASSAESQEESGERKESNKKPMFNAKNPEHKAKAEQLFKKFGDKEKVREKLKLEFEGL